jgi:molybdopterin biosynthesis enzyme
MPTFASLSSDYKKPEGLTCFFKGVTKQTTTGFETAVLKSQASYVVSGLLDANSWVVLKEQGSWIGAGTSVEVHSL